MFRGGMESPLLAKNARNGAPSDSGIRIKRYISRLMRSGPPASPKFLRLNQGGHLVRPTLQFRFNDFRPRGRWFPPFAQTAKDGRPHSGSAKKNEGGATRRFLQ